VSQTQLNKCIVNKFNRRLKQSPHVTKPATCSTSSEQKKQTTCHPDKFYESDGWLTLQQLVLIWQLWCYWACSGLII